MDKNQQINNSFYDQYGERWYSAMDDPVALLRAENRVEIPWVLERLERGDSVLDVGCGGGFLANALAEMRFKVTGVDVSEESLAVARRHDSTRTVDYRFGDAYSLPFEDKSFDVVCAMDFLEHIEDPQRAIKEFSRVLRPGGKFFFHTFSRNFLSWLIIIKLVEWLIPTTPTNMHVLRLFIQPRELKNFCALAGMETKEWIGIRPVFSSIPISSIFSGRVPKQMRFVLMRNLWLSYMGMARKEALLH